MMLAQTQFESEKGETLYNPYKYPLDLSQLRLIEIR